MGLSAPPPSWASIKNKPTTVAGFGLTDAAPVSSATVASTSGVAIDFTSIPSWAKRITINLNGVSTNGTSQQLIQIGSGSVLTSGYASAWSVSPPGQPTATAGATTGFGLWNGAPNEIRYAQLTLTLLSAATNTWVASHSGGSINGVNYYGMCGGGTVNLSGALDRVRITTLNGTDVFDNGAINVMWE